MNFYEVLDKKYKRLSGFTAQYNLSIYEFHLLLVIYKSKTIQLRDIIKNELMKVNQVNKSVKNLYDKKLINKVRLPMDERTVELSIKEDSLPKVEKMIKEFAHEVEKLQVEELVEVKQES
ncbi:hypothetical protein ERX35_007005 [Macrococcus equipercicus]|uniref:Transcriptional regulator SarA/SarZ/Rot-like helix-turn-helix domain-containing protein n=1 Tax=Macrococcus equipercicus TaxID=69967 RepID=A0ABQ6R872_9STAP|nr:hypothetical protein [Macrococcus equipercicus]KAA1039314.1 hypothetical protein ERX35_007005 [Macrococcus equipercicus]